MTRQGDQLVMHIFSPAEIDALLKTIDLEALAQATD
jgi:hypothetical protein